MQCKRCSSIQQSLILRISNYSLGWFAFAPQITNETSGALGFYRRFKAGMPRAFAVTFLQRWMSLVYRIRTRSRHRIRVQTGSAWSAYAGEFLFLASLLPCSRHLKPLWSRLSHENALPASFSPEETRGGNQTTTRSLSGYRRERVEFSQSDF